MSLDIPSVLQSCVPELNTVKMTEFKERGKIKKKKKERNQGHMKNTISASD